MGTLGVSLYMEMRSLDNFADLNAEIGMNTHNFICLGVHIQIDIHMNKILLRIFHADFIPG